MLLKEHTWAAVCHSHVEGDYYRAPKWRLTAKCHGSTILLATMRSMAPKHELKWEILDKVMAGLSTGAIVSTESKVFAGSPKRKGDKR